MIIAHVNPLKAMNMLCLYILLILCLSTTTILIIQQTDAFEYDDEYQKKQLKTNNNNNNHQQQQQKQQQRQRSMITLPLLHDHHIITRRHLESSSHDDHEQSILLPPPPPYGTLYQGYGTHYVDLWIGSPPQRQTVIVDTGSDITAFPCEECIKDCGNGYHLDSNFQHSQSTTFEKLNCKDCQSGSCKLWNNSKQQQQQRKKKQKQQNDDEYICKVGVGYVEGSSWTAFEARDYVYLGGMHDQPLRHHHHRKTSLLTTTTKQSNGRTTRKWKSTRRQSSSRQRSRQKQQRRRRRQEEVSNTGVSTTTNTKGIVHNTFDLEKEFKEEAFISEQNYKQTHHTTTTHTPHVSHTSLPLTAKNFTFPLTFGCQYSITGLFQSQLADGIMGMEHSNDSFWMQMYAANMIQHKMFSLCFTLNQGPITRKGTLAGAMTLGGTDVRLHQSKMVYAQNDSSDGWYGIYIKGIYLRLPMSNKNNNNDDDDKNDEDDYYNDDTTTTSSTTIKDRNNNNNNNNKRKEYIELNNINVKKLNSKGIIIDSGTTDTYLPSFINDKFERAYEELYGISLSKLIRNYNSDEININELPTIILRLQEASILLEEDESMYMDIESNYSFLSPSSFSSSSFSSSSTQRDVFVEIPPHHYISINKKSNKLEQRVHINDDDGYGILGANVMAGYDILFDMDHSRIGFAKSDCDSNKLVF